MILSVRSLVPLLLSGAPVFAGSPGTLPVVREWAPARVSDDRAEDDAAAAPGESTLGRGRLEPGLEDAADRALQAGLAYLARRQAEGVDGSFPSEAYENAPVGITALAALAFMAAGNSPGRGPYGKELARAIDYLLSKTDLAPESPTRGYIRAGNDKSRTHGHGFATLVLAEAHGMSPGRSQRVARALEAAVRLIERSQGAEGGWEYEPRAIAAHEGSVTVCLVQALRAARNSGIQVDVGVIRRAEDYVKRLQKDDGTFRYELGSPESTVALTAAAVSTLNMVGRYDGSVVQNAIDAIWSGMDESGNADEGRFPYYRRLYIAQAFWQLSDTSHFERWFEAEPPRLVRSQEADGSWRERSYGDCYATAINCLVLAIPEGLLPIFQR